MKTGMNIRILILLFIENVYILIRYMILQYGWEKVLIRRILIDFVAILENQINYRLNDERQKSES